MPNTFQNTQDFGGVNISKLPDKINSIEASDCNGIDFSLQGTIKTNGCGKSIGAHQTVTGYKNGDMYTFKKAFGTAREIMIRNFKKVPENAMKIQWFNEDITLGDYGKWEDLYDKNIATTARLSFAPVNGDNGEKINRLIISSTGGDKLVWNGATSKVVNWTSDQIVTDRDLRLEGFEEHPNKLNELIINGQLFTYTGIGTYPSNVTFTGVSPDPTGLISIGNGITQNANDELMHEGLVSISNVTFAAGTNGTITRATGTFTNDIFIGQKIFVQGATNAVNNGIFTVYNINNSNRTLVLEESTIANETVAGTVTISAGAPRGSIMLPAQGKLFISGVTGLESKVYYSVTNCATCFAITLGLASGGSFDLIEGGGYITAMNSVGKNKIVIHKRDSLTIYTRSVDTSANVIEDFDVACVGVGVGAAGQNAITSYGKTIYYFSAGGDIRTIEQTLYSTETFTFNSISNKVRNLLNVSNPSNPYLIYDSFKNRLILSTNSASPTENINMLVYVYFINGSNGLEYRISFDEFNIGWGAGSNEHFDIPIIVTTLTFPRGIILGIPATRNTYSWGEDVIQYDIQKNNYHISKEFTFDEPAKNKSFNILNIDGYLYGSTIIKFTVLYGVGGKDGIKSYYINKDSECVVDKTTYNNDYNLLGRNSITNNYNNIGIGNSYYFKMPLHIDNTYSDRYMIRIETKNDSVVDTFWAINNISTNVTLKDVDYNEVVNQNEVGLDGIGVMAVGSTNIVG